MSTILGNKKGLGERIIGQNKKAGKNELWSWVGLKRKEGGVD